MIQTPQGSSSQQALAANSTVSTRTVIEANLRLLREEKRCDVTFIVGESKENIQCHTLFLAARSSVFQRMFSEHWNSRSTVIEIPDIDAKTFRAFLEFIYSDKLTATVSEAVSLLYTAEKYDVQPLVEKCERLLESKMGLEDCIPVFQIASKYGQAKFMKKTGDSMAQNLKHLANDGSFRQMDKETLIFLLKRDDLRVKEVDLFKIVVEWGKNWVELRAASTVKEALEGVLPLIRFPIMAMNEFALVVVPTGLLSQETAFHVFTYLGSASDKAIQKSLESTLPFSTCPRAALGKEGMVQLYSGYAESEDYSEIEESLFDTITFIPRILSTDTIGSSFSPQTSEVKRIAITGIVLLCPFQNEKKGKPYRPLKTEVDESFDLSIENVHNKLNPLLFTTQIRFSWGREMDVEVTPPVLLKSQDKYRICVHQSRRGAKHYRYQPLDTFNSSPEIELDSVTLKMQMGREDYARGISQVSIIYKIKVAQL